MKIAIANESKQSLGGGWTFIRNLQKGIGNKAQFLPQEQWQGADILFIPSPTMTRRDVVIAAKEAGKKIVLRLDNLPRNSRNRNTGTSRLFDMAQLADKIVFQCQWSRKYLTPFIKKEGVVIYNGVDTEIFRPDGEIIDYPGQAIYLYCRFNRDETKNWEVAWYQYQMIHRRNPDSSLVVTGNFSPELVQYNFDFFMGERVIYEGIVESPERMAKIMRSCDFLMAPYYNDCYSNTYQEALACGLELFSPHMSGGTPELMKNGPIPLPDMANQYFRLFSSL